MNRSLLKRVSEVTIEHMVLFLDLLLNLNYLKSTAEFVHTLVKSHLLPREDFIQALSLNKLHCFQNVL